MKVAEHFRDPLAVFGLALGLRLVFSLLMANTYARDEFVYLALGRDVAHGAIPYRDFSFFHPPGILVVLALLDPLVGLWWPLARIADILIDSVTASLVWYLAAHRYSRPAGFAAGALYAVNPIALLAAIRVDQEPAMTALSFAGLTLLVTRDSHRTAVLAGACLAAACWIKYPMLLGLPIYLFTARRRAWPCLLGFLVSATILFLPYLGDLRYLYHDTIAWQIFYRQHASPGMSVYLIPTLLFLLVIDPFVTGCVLFFEAIVYARDFVLVYAHYFVPLAPYGALVSGRIISRFVQARIRATAIFGLAITVAWAVGIQLPLPQRGLVINEGPSLARLSDVRPIVQVIDRLTSPRTLILTNRSEYAYLANRPSLDHYFWDDHDLITAHDLERRLTEVSVIVLNPPGAAGSYPAGFVPYLDSHFQRLQLPGVSIWLAVHSRFGPMSRASR